MRRIIRMARPDAAELLQDVDSDRDERDQHRQKEDVPDVDARAARRLEAGPDRTEGARRDDACDQRSDLDLVREGVIDFVLDGYAHHREAATEDPLPRRGL